MDIPREVPEGTSHAKITNNGVPVYKDWSIDLLDDKQLIEWNEYKKHEMEGRSDVEVSIIRNTPVATRLQNFMSLKGYGVDKVKDDFNKGLITQMPASYTPKTSYLLPLGETILPLRQALVFWKLRKKEIEQKLKPGETTPKIHHEGFLEFQFLTPIQFEELDKKKNGNSKAK